MSINARDSILAAAAQLISREGARRLTLNAVAAEARLSKGGLLYHFSSKDDLIRGLVETLVAQFDAVVEPRVLKKLARPRALCRSKSSTYSKPLAK